MNDRNGPGGAWPEVMRLLWLGKGVLSNLLEPEIQLSELISELPRIRKLAEQLPAGQQQLAAAEWERQYAELARFRDRLDALLAELAKTSGKEGEQ